MIRDRKGEGGFMEAITALMVVSVALTAFMGLLAYSEIGDKNDRITLDTEFIEDMELRDGRLCGETHQQLERFVDSNGLNGARLNVSVAGPLSNASLTDNAGIEDGDNIATINGSFPLDSDDGRRFVASYEVVYWWD